MTKLIARYPAIAVGIPIGALMAIAELMGGGSVPQAVISLVIVAAYAVVVTLLGRRSETASALSGRPVDERWEHINLEACAYTVGLSAIVILAAFIVTNATGGAWQPYAFMASVIALSYLGSLLLLRARH